MSIKRVHNFGTGARFDQILKIFRVLDRKSDCKLNSRTGSGSDEYPHSNCNDVRILKQIENNLLSCGPY